MRTWREVRNFACQKFRLTLVYLEIHLCLYLSRFFVFFYNTSMYIQSTNSSRLPYLHVCVCAFVCCYYRLFVSLFCMSGVLYGWTFLGLFCFYIVYFVFVFSWLTFCICSFLFNSSRIHNMIISGLGLPSLTFSNKNKQMRSKTHRRHFGKTTATINTAKYLLMIVAVFTSFDIFFCGCYIYQETVEHLIFLYL